MTFLDIIEKLKDIHQRLDYHPEDDVYSHTAYVYYQLMDHTILKWVALFHDFGKIDTTEYDPEKELWAAHKHELYSVEYVDKFFYYVQDDVDIDLLKWLVENHMRIKFFDEMRQEKREKLVSEKGIYGLSLLQQFAIADNMTRFFKYTTTSERSMALIQFNRFINEIT